ncbi:MAG: hypothetical protein HRT57_09570 [Crocinitomicaceae bacterium]|nr:hypothetical protein [Crocinitomicaceae bacterium]
MSPSEVKNKRILISPLNWGFGHVSRCIGLIHQLRRQDNFVVVACNENQRNIFLEYFPNLAYVNHEGYPFDFRGNGKFGQELISAIVPLRERLKKEKIQTQELVEKFKIDLVIADHRYGFISAQVPSVFVTHQFALPVKWYEIAVRKVHSQLMKQFSEIWIMDYEDSRLAGKLSTTSSEINRTYIGPYSRFSLYDIPEEKTIESVLIISGPAAYGQKFLEEQLSLFNSNSVEIIASSEITIPVGHKVLSKSWKEQDIAIMSASHIVSRSGYSTIMDLEILKTPATMYPTKGQREQEYLYNLHR